MGIFRVKYSCLFLIILFVAGAGFAQIPGREVKINWLSPEKSLDKKGKAIDILRFENAKYLYVHNHTPSIELQLPGNVVSITITVLTTEALSIEESKLLPKEIDLQPVITHGYINNRLLSYINVIPLTEQGGGYNKVTSFTYTYQLGVDQTAAKTSFKTTTASSSSVLSTGDWYKFSIPNSGIFKIDYNTIKSMGLNPDQIDPRFIKIYGNGGGMLPQLNGDFRHDDLIENAIVINGENDGRFDGGDYILFYGKGPHTWTRATSGRYEHHQNIYSDYAYYFLTVSDSYGLRVSAQAAPAGVAGQTISTFEEHVFHESELENPNISGRTWYGEQFDYTTQQTFSFDLPGMVPNTNINIASSVLGRSYYDSYFYLQLNGSSLNPRQYMPGVDLADNLAFNGSEALNFYDVNSSSISGTQLNLTYIYDKGAYSSALGNLDYIEINLIRSLKLYNNYTAFRSFSSTTTPISEYIVGSAQSGMQIWDVTNPLIPQSINYTLSGSNASFLANSSSIIPKEYIVFAGSTFPLVSFIGKISNQDLHSIGTVDVPDMLIVTTTNFLSSAERLAQFRRTNDNFKVEVVTVDKIYNEFSSGAQDITAIRDFARMIYYRSTPTDSLKYLLLFGACSYDYKNRIGGNNNFVPVYETQISLDPIYSQSSDDYYGFFDTNEGEWAETFTATIRHSLEIGIGRFPVRNKTEAETMVNKVIHYATSNNCYGKWRNRVTFLADDGDYNLHLIHADDHAADVTTHYPNFNVNKIYLDAYPQISSPSGESSPMVREAVNQMMDKGSLIVNYVGHGGEQVLAQEIILDIGQIGSYTNYDKLSFFITATCEFGRYDAPSKRSGAEFLLINPNGGAVGLISSTRPVYANYNFDLNASIYKYIFRPVNNEMPRMGDVFKWTKNENNYTLDNRNYALLGDPSMLLAYPDEEAAIIKINNSTTLGDDTLRALGHVKLEGQINDKNGVLMSNYNGEANITIYDKEQTFTTLGTEKSSPITFRLRNSYIYDGTATVTNGKFNLEFIVPKDISYLYDKGKISIYSKSQNLNIDATGYDNGVVIGGTDPNAIADSLEPQVKLFMNDESFAFGGLTSANSLFLAKLVDDNGINVAGQGIGHEITGVLDDSKDVIILNDFYSPAKDSYKEGYVRYPMKNLSPGNHSIKFKCWDTYNNSAERYLEFVVANDEKIALKHVLNYPNPFSTNTTFHFDHNKAGEDLDVMVSIYTISGKLIKTLETRFSNSNTHFSDLSWDGRDDFGDKIGKGVYVYKVSVRSINDGSEVTKFEKLVLLN